MKYFPLYLLFLFVFYGSLLIRDVPRHGSISRAIDSWTKNPLFGLNNNSECYELRKSDSGLLLAMKDPNKPYTEELRAKGIPDGSVMRVDSTHFDPEPHLNVCRHYSGYFITRNGRTEWVLTKVR